MSYYGISQMRSSPGLQQRIVACVAQESDGDPVQVADEIMWQVVAEPGWSEAWDAAVAAAKEQGPQAATDPGIDPAVITDAMIFAAVQKHLAAL